jgi:peptidoglycan/LPS O-acetylase OafA/YrhL
MVIGGTASRDERLLISGNEAGTPPGDRKFRPDVQGMRAVAIFLALVYHAGIPGFHGGYVGIEVFFVISGFVITGLLLREREGTGHTSLRSFYGRRVRRIMPAATLVIIVAVIAAYVFLGPLSGNQTANDGRWASVFLINIHFSANGTNYLSALLPPSLLENYWSLAVEEQFYIVYPTLFILIGWWARKGSFNSFRTRLTIVLVAVIVASYVFSITDTLGDAQGAYFSLLTRSWELALGALIAVHGRFFQRLPQAWAAVASWAGLAVIMVTAVTLTGSSRYPGALVAIPTLGAGVVVAAGAAQPTWGVERLLRRKSFQFLAAISFPLYLWHWPILELAAQRQGTSPAVWTNIVLLLFAGVLATLTYYFFENPIRHNRSLAARRWASLALGGCLIVSTVTFTTVAIHLHPQEALATPGLANLQTGAACPGPTHQVLQTLEGTSPATTHRTVGRILVIGDSTACTMLAGLEAVGSPVGVRIEDGAVIGCGVVSGEIAPLYSNGVNLNSTSSTCQSRADAAEARAIRSGRPNIVLWSSSWERSSLMVGSGSHKVDVAAGSSQWYAVLRKRMEARIRRFTASGATVVLLTQAPFAASGDAAGPTSDDKTFERLNAFLKQIASDQPNVKIVDLADRVCPGGPPCPLVVDGIGARGDGKHYTPEGSLWVARWLMPQLGIAALDTPNSALPAMRMIRPAKGTVVKGTTLLLALASFNVGVAEVEFEISGHGLHDAVVGTAAVTHGLWPVSWNTTTVPNGSYTVRSIALNAAGDRSISKAITVKVDNTTR